MLFRSVATTIAGVAGTYRVTASSAGSVTFVNATVVSNNVTISTVQVVTNFATTSCTISSTTATINYSGPALANGDTVTIFGTTAASGSYNGTFTISNVATNSFQVTIATNTPTGSATGQGTIYIGDRYAFGGWAQDTGYFEYYEEGYETTSNTFAGAYGNIKAGTFTSVNSSAMTATELTAGINMSVPTQTVYDS